MRRQYGPSIVESLAECATRGGCESPRPLHLLADLSGLILNSSQMAKIQAARYFT